MYKRQKLNLAAFMPARISWRRVSSSSTEGPSVHMIFVFLNSGITVTSFPVSLQLSRFFRPYHTTFFAVLIFVFC